jgi:hypothetical protein
MAPLVTGPARRRSWVGRSPRSCWPRPSAGRYPTRRRSGSARSRGGHAACDRIIRQAELYRCWSSLLPPQPMMTAVTSFSGGRAVQRAVQRGLGHDLPAPVSRGAVGRLTRSYVELAELGDQLGGVTGLPRIRPQVIARSVTDNRRRLLRRPGPYPDSARPDRPDVFMAESSTLRGI